MVARHKVAAGVGAILTSFIDEDVICHEISPITVQKTQCRIKVDVHLCLMEVPWNSWTRGSRRRGPRIRKLVLGNGAPFNRVIACLSKFYAERGKKFVAARMQFDRPKRQNVWLNPELKEQLAEIKATRSQLENNGGQARSRFFQKSLRVQEAYFAFAWGEGSGRLARELENFSRDFQVFC